MLLHPHLPALFHYVKRMVLQYDEGQDRNFLTPLAWKVDVSRRQVRSYPMTCNFQDCLLDIWEMMVQGGEIAVSGANPGAVSIAVLLDFWKICNVPSVHLAPYWCHGIFVFL